MVLESVFSVKGVMSKPWELVFLAFVFVSISIPIAQFIHVQESISTIMLVSILSIGVLVRLFDYEVEEIEEKILGSRTLARHYPVVVAMGLFFVGWILGFLFWYLILPQAVTSQIFSIQAGQLNSIQGQFSGFATAFQFQQAFEVIFIHNLEVILVIIGLSIIAGAGAVLVLVWNASVISVFLANYAQQFILNQSQTLIVGLSAGFLGILPHGFFEMLAYILAALAGGILSSAVARRAYKEPSFVLILHDIIKLAAWAVILMTIGALIESSALL
ncbi:MAG: stage II sporulation protein M [Candidatus Marsarchaeota archaeon]|nr:stage II sporulation protein M [Candidatus Marsarchaeota archaeon]